VEFQEEVARMLENIVEFQIQGKIIKEGITRESAAGKLGMSKSAVVRSVLS